MEKVQRDTQLSTKHTYKTKDRETRTSLKTGGEIRCSGRVSSSCSTSDTRRGTYRGNLWHRYSITVNQVIMATVNFRSDDFNLTKRNPWFSNFLVSSNPFIKEILIGTTSSGISYQIKSTRSLSGIPSLNTLKTKRFESQIK
jgi:hypothetical protein